MEENKEEVVVVENEGNKGNPNHEPAGAPGGKGGQFASAPGDDVGVMKLEIPEKYNDVQSKLSALIGRKKEALKQQAVDYVAANKDLVNPERQEVFDSMSREDMMGELKNEQLGFDAVKLKNASDEELRALLYAVAIDNEKIHITQQIEILKQQKKDIEKDIAQELAVNNMDGLSGVWAYSTKYPSDWKELSESGSIQKKRDWYQGILDNENSNAEEKLRAKIFLKKLDAFEEAGQEYEKAKEQINLKYIDELENIESLSNSLNEQLVNYNDDNPNVVLAREFQAKFQNPNAAYSKQRKDKATWMKNFDSAYSHFSSNAEKHWDSMSSAEHSVIKAYTGSGYSRFNKPLRGIKHDAGGYSFGYEGMQTFSEGVNNLTNAIDKCTWDEDIWLNRYIANYTSMFVLPGSSKKMSLEEMTEEQRDSLVGMSWTDNGFVSCGAAKGTGYHTGNIVFNIYCPKGVKMAYVAPYSASGHGENEMIIQRGYQYKITKVEKKGGHYYLDMEVILGSDKNKPMGNDLKKLGNEYYYKPRHEEGEAYD